MEQYEKEFNESPAHVFTELRDKIHGELVRLTVNIESMDSYKFYEHILKVYTPHNMRENGLNYDNLDERFNAYSEIVKGLDQFRMDGEEEFKEFSSKCNKFFKRQSRQNLNPVYISDRFGSGMGKLHSYLLLIIILPVYYYGVINHLIALALPRIIGKFAVKDDHFASSVKLAVGMLSFPLSYTGNCLILYSLTHRLDWLIYYFISLLFSGIFAKLSQGYVKRFWEKFKFWAVKYRNPVDYIKIKKNFREIRRKLDRGLVKNFMA